MMSSEKTEEKKYILSEFDKLLSEKYLSYSLSTIISRSLPDVRDGLKPVHRRILFAMYELKLNHNSGFKKCARIIGDVIGKYHPHGDVAVYDSLVRLAQSFSLRYPLIEGQGNFGSVDGDNAAAMRYTESRLTLTANYLLDELNQETVNFKPTYDGQEKEPEILPAAFPNLLANGTEGIAVGMATNIPSHNLEELCDALIEIIKNPDISIRELIKIIPAPDFPTGGNLIFDQENMINIYESGRGSVTVRANWYKEELSHNSYQIVIDELPYQAQKPRIITKLAELFKEKKLPLLGNIIDESSENIRLVLVPKNRSVEPEILMEHVFKYTDLETNFNFNMNVITKESFPKLMSLKEILLEFLDYRKEIVTKRTNFRLLQINNKIELLEGYLIVYLNLDKIIEIIRYQDDPKSDLISNFNLTEIQAESVLNMRLRSLRKLEEIALEKELKLLNKEKSELQDMVSDSKKLSQTIVKEINLIKKSYSKSTIVGQRKTKLISKNDIKNLSPIENYSEKELITVICSKVNWIRSVKNHNLNKEEIKYKEGDSERFIIEASNHDKLLVFTELGKFYTIDCEKISRNKNTGEPIKTIIDIEDKDQIVDLLIYKPEYKYLISSKTGKGFVVESSNLLAQTKLGKNILTISRDDPAYICREIKGDKIAIIGENRKMLIFDVSEIPIMKKGQGVKLQKYQNSHISDLKSFNSADGLSWKKNDKIICQKDLTSWINYRGTSGKLPPANFPISNLFNLY